MDDTLADGGLPGDAGGGLPEVLGSAQAVAAIASRLV